MDDMGCVMEEAELCHSRAITVNRGWLISSSLLVKSQKSKKKMEIQNQTTQSTLFQESGLLSLKTALVHERPLWREISKKLNMPNHAKRHPEE